MIQLTKIDNTKIAVNVDNIKYIEAIPDTLINFINGDSLIVKEDLIQIMNLSMQYRSAILRFSLQEDKKKE